jgi:hypothetical protein
MLIAWGASMGIFRNRIALAVLFACCAAAPAAAQTGYNFGGLYGQVDANFSPYTSTWDFSSFRGMGATQAPANVASYGGLGTLAIGYNVPVFQLPQATVLAGVGGDFSFGTTPGRDDCFNLRYDCLTRTENNSTLRAILGLNIPGSPLMIYGTGGAATASIFDQKIPAIGTITTRVNPAILDGVTRQQWG